MIHEREDYNKRVTCTDGSIPEDEPVFLLRAKDPMAYMVVRIWATISVIDEGKRKSVLEHAERMRDYSFGGNMESDYEQGKKDLAEQIITILKQHKTRTGEI